MTPLARTPSDAWWVSFLTGETAFGSRLAAYYVRCVRRPPGTPVARCYPENMRYQAQTVGGMEEVVDRATGLTWQRDVPAQMMEWATAQTHCASLPGGWRTPASNELQTIVDYIEGGYFGPPIDRVAFPNTPRNFFWTSSTVPGVPTSARWVDFLSGGSAWNGRNALYYVRCVR